MSQEFLGCFKTQRDAAVAWDRRARRAEWSVLNFPVDGEEEMQIDASVKITLLLTVR